MKPGLYGDGGNLWLQVGPTGNKSWMFRYTFAGRSRMMGLGSFQTVTLAQAREAAVDKRLLLVRGIDPIADKRRAEAQARLEEASGITFEACAGRYIAAHKSSWKGDTNEAAWNRSLRNYVNPLIGKLRVSEIDTVLVLTVLEPIWTVIPTTARLIRGRIEMVLDWAKTREMRTGENPARWRGHIENLLADEPRRRRVKHFPALPYPELGDIMIKLRNLSYLSANALEFTILTAARSMEVINAKWPEINMDAKVWTIPAERMKTDVEHRVPLSTQAIAVLQRMLKCRKPGDYVFPGVKHLKPLSDHTLLMCIKQQSTE